MDFTAHWHDNHAEIWTQVVLPLLPETPRRWLELGSYEGKSAAWTLEHAIRQGDELVCVDGWWDAQLEQRFDANVGGRVTKIKMTHTAYLLGALAAGESFDAIYVDGDHDAPAVLSDCVLAWKVLRPNGVLILDDYQWRGTWKRAFAIEPCHAIDGFLRSHATRLRVLHQGYQVIVQRCP